MTIDINRCEASHIKVPLKSKYRHHMSKFKFADIILVKCIDKEGNEGWGESIPRTYVTGETITTVFDDLEKLIIPKFINRDRKKCEISFSDLLNRYSSFALNKNYRNKGSALCAFELAMLDLFSHKYNMSISKFFTDNKKAILQYSFPIGIFSFIKTLIICLKYRMWGQKNIKIKVGDKNEFQRVQIITKIIGKNGKYYLDANGGWDIPKVLSNQDYLIKRGITAIEQPINKIDLLKMNEDIIKSNKMYIAKYSDIKLPFIADESFCNYFDLIQLVQNGIIKMINIRISKCGGLIISNMLANIALSHGIKFIVGGMVGESNLLSTVEQVFALINPNYELYNGMGKSIYLKEQPFIINRNFKKNGSYPINSDSELTYYPNKTVISKYLVKKKVLKLH